MTEKNIVFEEVKVEKSEKSEFKKPIHCTHCGDCYVEIR